MGQIRVAQIGTGHDHAADIMNTLRMKQDLFDVVGYARVPEDTWNDSFGYGHYRERYDGVPEMTVEEILNRQDLDAVFIETEDRALTRYAIKAAERGFAIHMDKPGGISGDEFDRLIDLVEEKKLVFHVGYMYRYNKAIQKVKQDIRDGLLGEILSVEAQMNCLHGAEKRQWLADYPGGMMYFLGCHMVDLIYSIQGEPEAVIPLNAVSGVDGTSSEDFGMAAFRYPNGTSFAKSSALEDGGFQRRQLVVSGTRGTVEIRPLEDTDVRAENLFVPMRGRVREVVNHREYASYTTEIFGRYDGMLEAFASYVRGEKENPCSPEYERNLHRILLKACGVK